MATSSISHASTTSRINYENNKFSRSHPLSPDKNIEENVDALTNVDTQTLNTVTGKGGQKVIYTFEIP